MLPVYRLDANPIQIETINTTHFPPHLHQSLEFVYCLSGSIELGIRTDFYHMEPGDLAIVFPGLIHHFQVFSQEATRSIHLLISPAELESFGTSMHDEMPQNPVIPHDKVHKDIHYSIDGLLEQADNQILNHAFCQIILARSLPLLKLNPRPDLNSYDIVYQTVAYIARHFKENVTLTGMAKDLGVSPYALSRVFSATFHVNFNHFLNESRLLYAAYQLRHSEMPVTEIMLDAGFQSQATFNRSFQEKYHMTPREYRNTFSSDIKK